MKEIIKGYNSNKKGRGMMGKCRDKESKVKEGRVERRRKIRRK
jgi:hypothetical protein